jgi:hypothetical protein
MFRNERAARLLAFIDQLRIQCLLRTDTCTAAELETGALEALRGEVIEP